MVPSMAVRWRRGHTDCAAVDRRRSGSEGSRRAAKSIQREIFAGFRHDRGDFRAFGEAVQVKGGEVEAQAEASTTSGVARTTPLNRCDTPFLNFVCVITLQLYLNTKQNTKQGLDPDFR